jgi:flagellar biosynthesis/type III secretory pathway chaperone
MMTSLLEDERVERLVTLLRDELESYGELLSLLNAQQRQVLDRNPDAVAEGNEEVSAASEVAARARTVREECVAAIATDLQDEEDVGLGELLPAMPAAQRPLIEGLMAEINRTLEQAQRRARQNQILLARSIETIEQIVRLIRPEAASRTYTRRGSVAARSPLGSGARMVRSV